MMPDQTEILTTDLHEPELRERGAYPDLKSVIRLFFMAILFMIIASIPLGIVSISMPHIPQLIKSLLSLLTYLATFGLVINYAVQKSKKLQGYTPKIDLNKINGGISLLIILGAFALIIPLSILSDCIPMSPGTRKFFEAAFGKDIFSIITAIIAAPIIEELLCRGIILKGLLKNYPPVKAILISAIFFSLLHLNPWQAIPAFFGGLYMGWIYYRTKSVIPGMIIHFIINATATLFLFLPAKQQDFAVLLGKSGYVIAFAISIIVFALVCFVIHKKASVAGETSTLRNDRQTSLSVDT